MSLLTRYVAKELLKAFFLALVVVTLFMLWFAVTFNAPQELTGLRIALVLPYLLPEAIRNALQAATLFAVCVVYGRMSAQNELIALGSLGVRPSVVVAPALILGLLASLTGVWLYDVGAAWGKAGVERAVLDDVESIAYEQLANEHHYSLPPVFIRVSGVEGKRLLNPTVLVSHPDGPEGAEEVSITAEECTFRFNPKKYTLSVFLRNGTIETERGKLSFSDTIEKVIPLVDKRYNSESWPPRHPTLSDLKYYSVMKQRQIAKLTGELQSGMSPLSLSDPEFVELKRATQASLRDQIAAEQKKVDWLQSQIYRRWTNGFFSLAFAMIGVPVAVMLRSGDPLSAFFLCFLPIVLFNHPLHNFCIQMAESGRLPAWSPWIGNVVLMSCGAWLLQYVDRTYSPATPKLLWSWLQRARS